ncbi:hypothetical protein LXA43DRAFT_192381 [Ganoderma leucocontextum]|nr:hypothetical protein LXA43DRAFT_192381 [Ganoderma leucocontextum]
MAPSVHHRPLGTLPIEIYERVIDCIGSNGAGECGIRAMRNALCSCALTCQAWLPRSRVLLYQSVTLYSPRAYACNQDVVRRLTGTILASSFVAGLVEHLTVSEASASKSGIVSVLPILLVGRLPRLHTFTIQETSLVVSAAFCHSISRFPALTTLSLATVMLANVAALRRLLVALPKLRDLKFDNVFWQTVGVWRDTTGQYTRQMPRVRRLSMIGGQVVGPATWALVEFLAPHIEQLVFSDWNGFGLLAVDRKDDRLRFDRLASLTLRAQPRPLMRGLDDFLSKSRADQLRVVILSSRMMLKSRSDLPTMHRRLLRDSGMLERVVVDAGLARLRRVTIVAEVWDLSGRVVERLEEEMPAVVGECRGKLGSLHRRGLLKVAGATLVDDRNDETWVWVGPDEGTHAAPACTRRYGVPLLSSTQRFFRREPRSVW